MNNLDQDMLNDVRKMAKDEDSFGDATYIYDLEKFSEEWEFLMKEGQLPESWQELWDGEERSDEDVSEGSVSVYEEESESSEDDDDKYYVVEEEEYEREDDDVPPLNTEEKEIFTKGLNIFKSVTGVVTFWPYFVMALHDNSCRNDLEKKYLESGQYIPPEFLNILILFMAPSLGIELSEDIWLLILEYVQVDAKRLYADVLKPEVGKDDNGESKWMMFRRGIIFYTTFKKDDNIYFSGYKFDKRIVTSKSVMLPLSYGIPKDISDAFELEHQMLQNDWTKLMPKCDEAVKEIIHSTPRVMQLFIMMIMFGKLKDNKAMKLLESLQTSSIPTMTFLALVGHLLHEYCYREVKKHIPRGIRRSKIDIQYGPKRRTKREQVRVILQLLDQDKIGFNMLPKHDDSMDFNEIMRVMRKDILSLNVMSRTQLDNLLPWKDDAFDWPSFKFGFYNRYCDYSRYNPLQVSLKTSQGLWLTIVEVPKGSLLLCHYRGWKDPCSRLDLPRYPQESCVHEIVPERFHPGLTPELLKLRMYELPKQGDMFCLDFPERKLRCFVDGIREVVTPQQFKDNIRQIALDTLQHFNADGNFVYLSNSIDYRIRLTIVILRMYLQKDGGLARKSDWYALNEMLYRSMLDFKKNLNGKNEYEDVHVSINPDSPHLPDMLPPALNKMIQIQIDGPGFDDVVGTPFQYMAYYVEEVFNNNATVAYYAKTWRIPTFDDVEYRFYTVPKYKRFCLLGKNNLKRIGWLNQHQNIKEEDEYAGETVSFAIEDGKPKVNGKRVSSWAQFLRCLRFMKANKSVPQISGRVYNENYLQKPFHPVYWLREDGSIMVKLMALNENSTLLKKRTRSLKEWARRFLGSDADNSDDDDDTEAPNRQIKHLKLLEEARKTEEAKTTKNKL